MENKYLKLAREARKENNSEDAKKFYDLVRTENPENGEAKFFYAFYSLYEGKNIEIANRFYNLCNILVPSINKIAEQEVSSSEKQEVLESIVTAFVPETWDLNRYMNKLTVGTGSNKSRVLSNDQITSVSKNGMAACYRLGDAIEEKFGGDLEIMKLACKAWKEGISLQQKWYAFGVKGDPEKYTEKVKKYEPEYEMPQKAGCISFADKKNG